MKFKGLNMKKLIARVLPLMLALVLASCNDKSVNDISSDVTSEEEITEEKVIEAVKDTYAEQIQLFAEQKDMWLPEDFEPYAASVAIYDLDGDGILELMTTVTQGTGLYAYNNFYQADVENGRILELEQGPKEELAYGRLGFELASYGYERRNKAYMDENGRIYYPAVDYGRAGIAFSSCTEGVYYLENGVIMNEAIRSHTTDFIESEDGVQTYYVYDEAEPVTEEEWEAAYEEFAKGKVPQKINIAWKDFYEEEMQAISEVEWVEILTTSWQQALREEGGENMSEIIVVEALPWQKILCEYILRNLELSMRYQEVEMKEVAISYDPLRDIQIQVLTREDKWVDGRASSIPYEAWCDNEDDRDSFKECECQDDIIWSEFCDYCPHENIRPIMEKVCEELENTLEVPVKLRD